MKKNIHIGFGDSATNCLLEGINDYGISGDTAIPSRDDFTQGPISALDGSIDLNQRIEYWQSVNEVLGHKEEVADFYRNSIKLLDDIEAEEITIWPGNSCHDILAAGWLLAYLEDKNINWFIVNLATIRDSNFPNKLPEVNLAMYSPFQLKMLYGSRKPLTLQDKNYFLSSLQKASSENSAYRVLKGDKIISVNKDYFDDYILSNIQEEFEPAKKVIGRMLRDGQHRISDTTVEWNIRKLINRKILEYEGELTSMTTYSVRYRMPKG